MNCVNGGRDQPDCIDEGGAASFQFEPEGAGYLVGDDKECGGGNISRSDRTGDVLNEVSYFEVGADEYEETNEENEEGHSCEHFIASQCKSGKSAEEDDGGGIGRAECNKSIIGKKRADNSRNGRSIDAVLYREASD